MRPVRGERVLLRSLPTSMRMNLTIGIRAQAGKTSLAGSTTCSDCGLGKYLDVPGSAECSPVAAGYYTDSTGETNFIG